MRKTLVVSGMVILLAAALAVTGCDKAEKAAEKTGLVSSAEITKLIGNAAKAVAGITDIESARAALPKLQGIDGDLGKLVEKVKGMSPDQKSTLTGAVSQAMPQLEGAIGRVSAMAGVGEIVGPTLDSLKNKLKSMM